jgi:hypothetical protein
LNCTPSFFPTGGKLYTAGAPSAPEPPDELLAVADRVHDPLVRQSGITTTTDGRWALYVTVPGDTKVPIENVERQAGGFPVVYQAEPKEPPRAGPAYPRRRR